MPLVPLKEAFDDTPLFRERLLEESRRAVASRESIARIVRISAEIARLADLASAQRSLLIQELDQPLFDETIAGPLRSFQRALTSIEERRKVHKVQVDTVLIDPLAEYQAQLDVAAAATKRFDAADSALKTSMEKFLLKRAKKEHNDALSEEVALNRMNLHLAAIELGGKLNEIKRRRACQLSENALALMYTEMAFHHQCFEVLAGLQPVMDALSTQLHEVRGDLEVSQKAELVAAETAAQIPIDQYHPGSPRNPPRSSGTTKAGYLFVPQPSSTRRAWRRQWFEIAGSNLSYINEAGTKISLPLSISMVRQRLDDPTRSNVFEVVNPTGTLTLQAISDSDLSEWIAAIQSAISRAIHAGNGPGTSSDLDDSITPSATGQIASDGENSQHHDLPELAKRLRLVPGNDRCADCSQASDVVWASVNLGLLLCIDCSGLHRGLGSHISKVRSLALDKWSAESIELMEALGNQRVNAVLEATLSSHSSIGKPTEAATRSEKETFLQAKYSRREFVRRPDSEEWSNINEVFFKAVGNGDSAAVLSIILNGFDCNAVDSSKKSALHHATELTRGATVELLLNSGASVNVADENGRTPLHVAAAAGSPNLVTLLFKRGADLEAKDSGGLTAEAVALQKINNGDGFVRTVTILRLLKFQSATEDWQQNSEFDEALNEVATLSVS